MQVFSERPFREVIDGDVARSHLLDFPTETMARCADCQGVAFEVRERAGSRTRLWIEIPPGMVQACDGWHGQTIRVGAPM